MSPKSCFHRGLASDLKSYSLPERNLQRAANGELGDSKGQCGLGPQLSSDSEGGGVLPPPSRPQQKAISGTHWL